MAAKKSSTTSKTARVLNVISGEASSAAEEGVDEIRQPPQATPVAPTQEATRPPVAPILEMVRANDDALAEQLRTAMEVDLRTDAPPTQPAPQAPAAPPTLPQQDVGHTADDLEYINVMQSLVEEKAAQFMDLFGLCTCHRCMTDVMALTLTNLPPKYVVMRRGEVVPMLTVYERRYNANIIAQLTHSCRMVMASPRHQR